VTDVQKLESFKALTQDKYRKAIVILDPPGDEDPLSVSIKLVSEGEVRDTRKAMTWPTAPFDLQKNSSGQVERVYNEEDPGFISALEDANREFGFRLVIISVDELEIPGETIEDQIHFLSHDLGGWVITQLLSKIMEASGISSAEVETRSQELESAPLAS